MESKLITILGVGNLLFTDEGVGVRVAEALQDRYDFPENVKVVDGGTLGMGLLGVISEADYLIVSGAQWGCCYINVDLFSCLILKRCLIVEH